MQWYRIDMNDGDSKFYEIDATIEKLKDLIMGGYLIQVNRSLVLFPHKDTQGKDGLAAAQLKDMNPTFIVCNEEWIVGKHIKGFGVVNIENEAWKQISEKALGERHILTPKKSLLLS